jgi:hypothetical protein
MAILREANAGSCFSFCWFKRTEIPSRFLDLRERACVPGRVPSPSCHTFSPYFPRISRSRRVNNRFFILYWGDAELLMQFSFACLGTLM